MDTKQKNKIEEVSQWYKTEGFYKKLLDFEFEEISAYFSGQSLLEIGSADGYHLDGFLPYFKDITCIEPSEDYCSQLTKKYGKRVQVVNAFVEEAPVKGTFDTIVCAHVLEHVPDPVKALRSMRRFMHEKTTLIIIVPNANSLHRQIAVEMGMLGRVNELNELDKKLGHFRVYDKNSMNADIKTAGLKVKHFGGIFLKVLSNKQLESWDDKLLDGFHKVGSYYPELAADIMFICGL